MKKAKFVVSLVLVVAFLSSISVCAFAASPPSYVITQFRNFQYIEQGHTSTYVRILQKFLLNYNWTTWNFINTNGGVDGSFGLGTYYATYEFQTNVFSYDASQWDGKVGSNTWEQVCRNMEFIDQSEEGVIYKFYRGQNLIVSKIANIWSVIGNDGIPYQIYV